ncbi:ABC-type nitrate/sulfonate/bicarbonate transport system, permease component [Nocardia amikacinitolerans]|uniref:ABC-type nitrate/sulfonate/bicarbonate transport system, permease component n=1 Tax=Nocardia amikacinitolerans TaxID=756689 RepID=A0A285LD88_9NOCA|nr:ABC transporter permease subunit [Nocardia amikacinitolerans]MCP2277504.1 ABC-type nitrate/sulfonate/bicarbonate transport system, permease component [Nocardia amikacinitolerans]MCP2298894.1 ABC-type nitrate/sulfonate/bicarbonate transport system, permease component [Nocardia amikacinitolerans]SNY81371.1 ABC-type nitrate/sulfonate/bicarbonate transport system, permease component [Nocardia amikacinitolerans]
MKRLGGLLGILGLVGVWWLAAALDLAGGTIPSPWRVLHTMYTDGWQLYGPNFEITAIGALKGFLWGNALAIGLAVAVALIPQLESLATQLAILSYCTPLLALGPIILVVFGGRTPTVFLAAMYCFFTTMVGSLAGLRSADRASLELVHVYGGGRWQRLYRVQLIAALPNTLAALKIAAPSAVLGAIIGEYLGGVDSGIGVALTAAQTAYNVPRTWGMALGAAALAGLGYAIVAVVARLATPWTGEEVR